MFTHEEILERMTAPVSIARESLCAADSEDLTWLRNRVTRLADYGGFQVIGGPGGTGKTFGLYYLHAALGGDPQNVVSASRILKLAFDDKQRLDSLSSEILGIDDLGAEYASKSDWTPHIWDCLIDDLVTNRMPCVISTNLTATQLGERYGDRFMRRLQMFGDDWYRLFKRDWSSDPACAARRWTPAMGQREPKAHDDCPDSYPLDGLVLDGIPEIGGLSA